MGAVSPRLARLSPLLVLVTAAALAACSRTGPEGAIRFELEPVPAQPWVASGELVDAGAVCPEGSRRNAGLFAPDGTPITFAEFAELADAAGIPWEEMEVRSRQEWTCADGSGTITMMEVRPPSFIAGSGSGLAMTWRVEGGIGAYAGAGGEGTFAYELAPSPTAAGDPPEGEIVAVVASGWLEMPAD